MFEKLLVKENVPLRNMSSFRIGGMGRFFLPASSVDELRQALEFARDWGIRLIPIGRGTNILFGEGVLNYFFVKLSGELGVIEEEDGLLKVGAGADVSRLVSMLRDRLSVFRGLPGTVGGAVKGNAGVRIGDVYVNFMDVVERLAVMDEAGRIEVLYSKDIDKGYRFADVDGIVLFAWIRPDLISDFWGIVPQRVVVEPYPNAGSIFKNPSMDVSAGYLIDLCGFKGRRLGGAMVSRVHANFILNVDDAGFDDVYSLIEEIEGVVFERTGYRLEREIRIIPNYAIGN